MAGRFPLRGGEHVIQHRLKRAGLGKNLDDQIDSTGFENPANLPEVGGQVGIVVERESAHGRVEHGVGEREFRLRRHDEIDAPGAVQFLGSGRDPGRNIDAAHVRLRVESSQV